LNFASLRLAYDQNDSMPLIWQLPRLLMGKEWRVRPTDELLKRLRQLLSTDAVRVSYERIDFEAALPYAQTQLASAG